MREKKTDPELPILLPFRPGIVSNGEFLPPEPNRRHRRAAQRVRSYRGMLAELWGRGPLTPH